jgi:putative oxidoreductase
VLAELACLSRDFLHRAAAMKKLIPILQLRSLPANADLALLALRLSLGLSMLLVHGWSKFTDFSTTALTFPDSFGLGSKPTLVLAIFTEVFCSALLVAGLFTRLAALAGVLAMATAFFLVNGAKFSSNGELAFLYLAGYVVLLLAGGGKFSAETLPFFRGKNAG